MELLIVILVLMWLSGFLLHVGGDLVHLLLLLALLALIYRLVKGRRVL